MNKGMRKEKVNVKKKKKKNRKLISFIIAGVAWVGTVCEGSYANEYRVSITRDLDFNAAQIGAHELAHG